MSKWSSGNWAETQPSWPAASETQRADSKLLYSQLGKVKVKVLVEFAGRRRESMAAFTPSSCQDGSRPGLFTAGRRSLMHSPKAPFLKKSNSKKLKFQVL